VVRFLAGGFLREKSAFADIKTTIDHIE